MLETNSDFYLVTRDANNQLTMDDANAATNSLVMGSDGYLELYKSLNPSTDATYQANVKLNVNGDSFFRGGSVTIGDVSPLTTGGTPRLSLRGAGLNIGAGTNDMSYIRRTDTGDYQWQTWNGANDITFTAIWWLSRYSNLNRLVHY